MSNFFGAPSSGSGPNANGSSSNSGSGGGGGGGGGWGSFLKQGLSTIESKIDMVLDIQVPIPGGTSNTLTSFSPHANVLPSSITGATTTTKETPPKRQTSSQVPSALQGDTRKSQDVITDDDRVRKSTPRNIASSQDLRKSVVSANAMQDETTRRNSSQGDDTVTVDAFTGMVTTGPGIKRMSTPPASSGLSASAAAAAAAANRERLEQRMRGIFKKPAESPPTTPPSSKGASLSPSARKSVSTELEEKDDISSQQDDAEEREDKVTLTKVEKTAKMGDTAEPTTTQEDKSEQKPETPAPSTAVDTKGTEPTITDNGTDKEALDKAEDAVVVEGREQAEDSTVAGVIKEDAEDIPVKDAAAETSSKETVKAPLETQADKEDAVEESDPVEEAEATGAPTQDQLQDTNDDEIVAEIDVPPANTEHALTRTSSESDIAVPSLGDRPDTPLSTAESDQATTESEAEPTAPLTLTKDITQPESKKHEDSSTAADTNPLKRVLDQREEQLFKVMQEQSTLIDRLRDLEDAKAAEDARNAVKVAGLEKMIETQKKELEVARGSNLVSQPKSIQRTLEEQRGLLEEKDEQIRGLLAEGEVLSKKEFKHLTTIKTLRMKTIEMEKNQMDAQKKMDKVVADCTDAQAKVARLTDENKQLQESVKSLHDNNQRQSKQATKMEAELVQLREDKANLQMGLDRAWQELAEARKASAELSSQTHAAALEREMKMNEDLHDQLDSLKAQHAAVESTLRQDIQELRVSLSNREELAGEKEDQLWMEIRSLQARLEQNDHDSYELQETLDEARRPLLHQIEILQNQQGVANRNWDKIEKSLTRRIAEAEESTAKAQERERVARDKLDEVKSQIITLEARLETLRIADTQLRSEMNTSKRTMAEKEEAARQAQAELSRERLNRERAVEEAKEDAERKWRKQQQAEVDKLKAQIQQLQQQRTGDDALLSASSDSLNARRPSSSSVVSVNSPMLGGVAGGPMSSKFAGNQGRTSFESMTSPTSLDGMAPSMSRSSSSHTMSGMGAGTPTVGLMGLGGGSSTAGQAVALERLNTMVRQLESQVTFLSEQVRSANRNKDELSDELVKVTMELEELQSAAARVSGLEQELTLLKDRHRAALEMLGEKTEEVQELRADILDVKEAYRDQINELLAQLEKLRRANAQ